MYLEPQKDDDETDYIDIVPETHVPPTIAGERSCFSLTRFSFAIIKP